jgi:DNA-binding transcriptional LysR family regulator
MDIGSLHAFIEVADAASFSGAAERLHLSQPAVSKRIAALESELGAPLFDRTGRRVRLTQSGQALLPRARDLLVEVADIKRQIANLSLTVSGTLTMGTSHHIGLHRLPPVLRAFSQSYPQVRLDIRFMDSEGACRAVELGELELAIVTLPTDPKRTRLDPLWEDRLRCVVAPGHPLAAAELITPAELVRYPAVLPSPATYTRALLDTAIANAGLTMQIAMSTNYLETLKMLATTGLGWTLLPESMIDPGLIALSVQGLDLRRRLGAVTREGASLSNAAQAMVETCRRTPSPSGTGRG